jgi:hypothetical protein
MATQGLTAQYLTKESYEVKKGDWVLIRAAAGGVGLLLCQVSDSLLLWGCQVGHTYRGGRGSGGYIRLVRLTTHLAVQVLRRQCHRYHLDRREG